MKTNGLIVNEQAIADGMYDMILDRGEEGVVAFGMIPRWVVDLLELHLRDKVIEISAQQMGCTVEEFKPHIDEAKVKATVQTVVNAIVPHIYAAAKQHGMMVV